MKTTKVAVLITTDTTKRGVFMGFIDPKDIEKDLPDTLHAEEVRMAVYWSADVKGVLGLASTGPTEGCKITKAAKKAVLKGVTAAVEITSEALKAWEKEPWSN